MDKEGWVTVNRKAPQASREQKGMKGKEIYKKKEANINIKEKEPTDRKPKEANESLKEQTEADDLLKEERKQKNILKKLRLKEERKYKREQLARELQEIKRRDTKVTVISQAAIDYKYKNDKSNKFNSFMPESPSNAYNPLSSYVTDYPTLQGIHLRERNKPDASTVERNKPWNPVSRQTHNTDINASLNHLSTVSLKDDKGVKPTSHSSKYSPASQQKFISSIKNNPALHNGTDSSIADITPVKRKVKTKDLINLEIMDLIELKKKSQAQASKSKPLHHPPPAPPEKIERRGKVSEGKKKMTTLKKNQLRQKAKEEDFVSVLTEICEPNENMTNLEETSQHGEEENTTRNADESSEKSSSLASKVKTNGSPMKFAIKCDDEKSSCRQAIIRDLRSLMNPIHSRKFREYCTHVLSPEIDQVLKELIEMVVMFHQRLYHQDPVKAKMRRRFYCGLKEALKHMNKVTCLVMAPNLKPSPGKGCLDELVTNVMRSASEHGVFVVFGLTDRFLGRLSHRKVPSSCISLVNIQGAQDKFVKLKDLVAKARKQYEELLKTHTSASLAGTDVQNTNGSPAVEDTEE